MANPNEKLITPTVHLNGTSRSALFEQYSEAAGAVRSAIRKLAEAAPNARDYYPQGTAAMQAAAAQHASRELRLLSVMRELQEIAEAIGDAS